MFDEFTRELRRLKLDQGVQIPIGMPVDDKGYFDRECPHKECGAFFKVLFDDWHDKVPDAAAYCPKCGIKEDPAEFNTEWQRSYTQKFAQAYAAKQLDKAFSRAARRTMPKRLSGGLFDFEMDVTFHAGPTPVVLPSSAQEVLRQDFECGPCGFRYSTIGAGYFCPACGYNSAVKDFDQTIDTTLKVVEGLEEIKLILTRKYDLDAAANVEQQILEDQIKNLVMAFQRVAEALFCLLPNTTLFSFDQNLFQRIHDGSDHWFRATGKSYRDLLSTSELEEMATMVQRRHKLSHNEGMIDKRYVEKSGDFSYDVGQRLVIRKAHVKRLAKHVRRLVEGLRVIVTAAKP